MSFTFPLLSHSPSPILYIYLTWHNANKIPTKDNNMSTKAHIKPYAERNKTPISPTVDSDSDVMAEWESLKRLGRPSKISQELIDTVCNYIYQGNYIVTACNIAGITRTLYDQWIGKASQDMADGKTEMESPFIHFLVSVEKAYAFAEYRLLSRLQSSGAGTWQKFAWMLERTRPQTFGPRQQLEITQDVTLTSVSLPAHPQDFTTWLSNQLATNDALKSLRTTELDISDADVVSDTESLERVDMRQIGENPGKDK